MSFKTTVLTVLGILLLVFVLQNSTSVELRFLIWKAEISRAIVLVGVFGVGLAAGFLMRRRNSR